MKSVVELNAFRCRMWDLHDRLEEHVSEATCKAEIESFARHGQMVPVLGRVVRGDPDYDAELIFGSRRLFVARHLNKPLLVDLRSSLSDREALLAMDIENRLRSDLSPYERGVSLTRWLRTGHFQSQEDIARALSVSASQVSRLLKLAQLPSVVVDAFASPTDIRECWGLELAEELTDPSKRALLIRKARSIAELSPRPPAPHVFRDLMAAGAQGRRRRTQAHDEVVKDWRGIPLFRIRQHTSSVAVVLPATSASAKTMERIRHALTGILQDGSVQTPDCAMPPAGELSLVASHPTPS